MKTCIIIPCYNEEKRISVDQFDQFISDNPYFFCFVNDGSTDNTAEIIKKLQGQHNEKIYIINYSLNKGKAEAVRTGINHMLENNQFDYVGYLDADLAIPLEEIEYLLHFMQFKESYKFALGSRIRRLGTDIKRNTFLRHVLGRFFATLISNMLHLVVYDTQCGIKIIKSDLAKQIFDAPFITKWLFDIELIARIIKFSQGNADLFIEVPLRKCVETGRSKIKIWEAIQFPFELFKIKRKYF